MKLNKASSLFLVLFLAGCSSISAPTPTPTLPQPTSTFTPLPTNTPTPTATLTPLPTLTPTPPEVKTISKRGQTILNSFQGTALSLAWTKDGRTLFVGTEKSGLIIYDVENKRVLANPGGELQIQALALSPDEKTLAVGIANDNSIRFIDPQTGDLMSTLTPTHDNWVQVLAFSPDGKVLASSGDDGQILLWDVATGQEIKQLYKGKYWIWGMAFSPDGKSLLAGFDTESTFRVWDTTTWDLQRKFEGDFAADLAFSPDGSKFATAGGGFHEANIWDFKSGNKLFKLGGLQSWVWAIAYSPDGKYVASGGIGNVVVVWDANTGYRAYELATGDDFIQTLAYSPDGTKLASGGSEVVIWDMSQP